MLKKKVSTPVGVLIIVLFSGIIYIAMCYFCGKMCDDMSEMENIIGNYGESIPFPEDQE